MARTCYRCGTEIDERTAFCPSCAAPQIRVAVSEEAPEKPSAALSDEPVSPALEPGTPESVQPPAMPVTLEGTPAVHWKAFLRIALVPAIITAAVSCVSPPFALLLFIPAGVVLSIVGYRRRFPARLTTGLGARMGAGLACLSFVFFLVPAVIYLVLNPSVLRDALLTAAARSAVTHPDPAAQQMLHSLANSASGLAFLAAFTMGLILVLYLAIGSISGALTAHYSGREHQP